ncbi:MAG: hypothetical protein RLY14_1156 [Planctomycetota bacterium]
MSLEGPERLLYDMVKSQLGSNITMQEVERVVLGVAAALNLDPQLVQRVTAVFRAEIAPSPVDCVPRLLVDWGELPRVGHQVRPEFSLICPAYETRPEIKISVDRDLDHDENDPRRRPQADDKSLWSFHVPFRMTTGGLDCRPGQYLIDFEVSFREVPADLPRFYRCRIRLTVNSGNDGEGGVLEIDGDGQSVVNLQGCNLKQFSKVILKGSQDSIINLANGFGQDSTSDAPAATKPNTTFEYQLKVDHQKQGRLPKLLQIGKPRSYLDSCGFFFEDGSRYLVFARPKITFGRSRDNDVILRFFPRSQENDAHSGNISRTHFIAELIPEGIEIRDESRSGIELNYSVVRERISIPAIRAGEVTHLELGVTGTVPKKFKMEMVLFSPEDRDHLDELSYWDELVCEIVGGRLSRISREGLDASVNSVRYDRASSLEGEECYVHLFREAIIGGSPARCAIVLKNSVSQPPARLLHIDRSFWLETLSNASNISIDGMVVPPLSLVALSPGMQISFGGEVVKFDRPSQLYLD